MATKPPKAVILEGSRLLDVTCNEWGFSERNVRLRCTSTLTEHDHGRGCYTPSLTICLVPAQAFLSVLSGSRTAFPAPATAATATTAYVPKHYSSHFQQRCACCKLKILLSVPCLTRVRYEYDRKARPPCDQFVVFDHTDFHWPLTDYATTSLL